MHYGSVLVFDGKGGLFVTTGERSVRDARVLAQDVTAALGKVVRIDPMTGAPMGDPGSPTPCPRSGPGAIATCRARPWGRMARCGP